MIKWSLCLLQDVIFIFCLFLYTYLSLHNFKIQSLQIKQPASNHLVSNRQPASNQPASNPPARPPSTSHSSQPCTHPAISPAQMILERYVSHDTCIMVLVTRYDPFFSFLFLYTDLMFNITYLSHNVIISTLSSDYKNLIEVFVINI